MHCDQIQKYLDQYTEGTLPGYKAAWVVQHLAGCPSCSALVDTARQHSAPPAPAPAMVARRETAATVRREQRQTDSTFEAVQRPIPRWLQWATAVLISVAAGGAVWLVGGRIG